MRDLTPIDELEYRLDTRKIIKEIGIAGSYQMLYEMLRCTEILVEEIIEAQK